MAGEGTADGELQHCPWPAAAPFKAGHSIVQGRPQHRSRPAAAPFTAGQSTVHGRPQHCSRPATALFDGMSAAPDVEDLGVDLVELVER